MIFNILKFELRYWFKQPLLYIFFFINALLIMGASSSDSITVGGSLGNVHKNAPYVVENFYGIMSLLSLLMITAFLNSAAARDFSEKTSQIFFATPIKKSSFLFGRFIGAYIISIIPFLGISLGNIIGGSSLFWDADRLGAFNLGGHLNGILVFIIPNLFFAGAIIFSIAALTRSTVLSFIGTIGLLVGYIISMNMIRDLDSEFLGAMIDPFGIRTFNVATKYWTVDDKNTMSIGLQGYLLWNRLIWIAVGALVLFYTYMRFSFEEKSVKVKKSILNQKVDIFDPSKSSTALLKITPEYNSSISFRQFISQIKIETTSILKNTAFIVIMIFGAINLISSMSFATSQGYGLTAFPVTYSVVDIIEGSFFLFIIAVITFYTGIIVWKERDSKVNDIYDALPFSDWIPLLSKTIALWLVVEVLLVLGCVVGVITQFAYGFDDIRFDVYFIQMILVSGVSFLGMISLSVFIHVLVNNKYLGYFVFIAFIVANNFGWQALDVESNLAIYGGSPSLTYSDMNGFGPFLKGKLLFESYWALFSSLLIAIGLLYWVRGRENTFASRSKMAKARFKPLRPIFATIVLLIFIFGGYLFYNTKSLNTYVTTKESERQQVDFEKKYKKYENAIQPRVTDIEYTIDLYPNERKLLIKSKQWVKNKSAKPIETIYFTDPIGYDCTVEIKSSTKTINDTILGFRAHKLKSQLLPGDSIEINYTSKYEAKGVENEVSNTTIVDNGTFFNNATVLPQIGYLAEYEITDKNKRKKYDLPPRERIQKLSDDPSKRMSTYISNNSDWVNVKTTFSTSADQIAIAPGSLRKKWTNDNRAYFQYELDHYSLNFYSFLSGRFQVKTKKYKGLNLEVYYDAKHPYNVDKMLISMEKSVDYYSQNFGKYYHLQTRIIEFPRYASFAQAFPGTMPYSESIGFIANLEDSNDIDMVTYVVAHEMGHQWWAHQICGPDMQGSTMMSESMAQYSALMVMEKMYGKDQMHKFLRYEMDRYLRSRGSEDERECPLMEVENQGYVHYNKASVIMYYFKEMIGETQVNLALKDMIDSFAYRQPPYPNSREMVNRFNQQTPDSLKYLITDLFYKMTMFDNRVTETSIKKTKAGYEVKFTVAARKFYADSLGREKEIAIHDWIDVGVFAKPEEGKKLGKPLLMQKIHLDKNKREFTFITKENPYQVGIDPYYFLVDRVPSDNLKKVDQI